MPAVAIQWDYSLDLRANGGSGLFEDNPAAKAILSQVGADLGSRLTASLPAIQPGGGNSWTPSFFNPATGQSVTKPGLTVADNTITVYVGGRAMSGGQTGFGGPGGYSASGSQAWFNTLAARGPGGALLWGGSITFDSTANWWFGSSVAGIGATQIDFYSIAAHELGHVLGIGTSQVWSDLSVGGRFTGAAAEAVYGGAVPLSGDGSHWASGVGVDGQLASLDPSMSTGIRITTTSLDYAALRDLGWTVTGVAGVAGGSPANVPPVVSNPPGTDSPLEVIVPPNAHGNGCDCAICRLVVLTGPTDGSAQIFGTDGADGLAATSPRFQPFPGYTGTIRSAVADFDGDGVADYAFGTGAGTAAQVRIISGATGTELVGFTTVLDGFNGGVFLAAGDVDRDGAAELAVSADAGGGNRVSLFKVAGGQLRLAADFMAFGDEKFRGGSRVALGDVNGDGAADLIVGAGVGGGPRVAVYDGAALVAGKAARLVPDFFALDSSLRSGVFVTAGDFDGDGRADVAYSTGNTGGPRVRIVSGALLLSRPGTDVAALPALADFFALDPNDRSGIRIAARDLDADGRAELVVASGSKTNATVRVIRYEQMGGPITSLQDPFGDPLTVDGIYVG